MTSREEALGLILAILGLILAILGLILAILNLILAILDLIMQCETKLMNEFFFTYRHA